MTKRLPIIYRGWHSGRIFLSTDYSESEPDAYGRARFSVNHKSDITDALASFLASDDGKRFAALIDSASPA